jgi:general secretion pathway protein K
VSEVIRRPDQRGVVLLVVLFFTLLLAASITSFVRRSTVDSMVAHNREHAAQAAALARGGIEIAQALLIEDRLIEGDGSGAGIDTEHDLWAKAGAAYFEAGAGRLRIRIEDAGAKFNLNALFETNAEGLRAPLDATESFLIAFFEKIIDELPLPPGETALYDVRDLTANLIDWVDGNEVKLLGGPEDDYYQAQDPPYYAANGPLLTLDELRLIEGFDGPLVEGMRPYVTVYPFAPGGCGNAGIGCGVNVNTAPPHVLALLFFDDGVELRLADEDVVRDLLELREEGSGVCGPDQSLEGCTPISEIVTNAIFPPPTVSSQIFVVTADAEVGDVRRSIEAVVDRTQPLEPRLLSWRVR